MSQRKDDRVRELFEWIGIQGRNGVPYATIAAEMADRARTFGLICWSTLDASESVREFAFRGSKFVIRHGEKGWQLV